jgi:hypothetical protein
MGSEKTQVTKWARCMCGDIQFEYRGAPIAVMHWHGESCRRHPSEPIPTSVILDNNPFRFSKGAPVKFMSSTDVERAYCGRRGSPLTYDGRAAATPSCHAEVAETLPWIEAADGLPHYGTRNATAEMIEPDQRVTALLAAKPREGGPAHRCHCRIAPHSARRHSTYP